MITEVAERDDAPKSRREKVFVPDSSPTHALEVLKQIPKEGMVAPEHVAHRTTLTNLLALKLIKKEKSGRYVPAVSSRYADPLFWMQRAVSSAECIRVARTVLTLNPAAGGREIFGCGGAGTGAEVGIAGDEAPEWQRDQAMDIVARAVPDRPRQEQLCGGPGRVFPGEKGDEAAKRCWARRSWRSCAGWCGRANPRLQLRRCLMFHQLRSVIGKEGYG